MTRRRSEAGFTMIEVMVAVLLTAIAVIGLVGLYRVQTRSAGYSRRSTEASVLAGDKLEQLRTEAISAPGGGTETGLDSRGVASVGGPFSRTWTITQPATDQWKLQVDVTWDDDGTMRTLTVNSLRGVNGL